MEPSEIVLRNRPRGRPREDRVIWSLKSEQVSGKLLSRRDLRTQPEVLIPGTESKKSAAPKWAVELALRSKNV